MREIPNELLSMEGKYGNPGIISVERTKDLVVARTFTPRSYINKSGAQECAILPEIIICEATKKAPIKINESGIIAKSPAICYTLQFNPSWNGREEKGKEIIYKFERIFLPQDNGWGDIYVYKQNITGKYDERGIPGEISYSGIDNRDVTLKGQIGELEVMLNVIMDHLPRKLYGLSNEVPHDAAHYYDIVVGNEDIEKFAKDIVCKIF